MAAANKKKSLAAAAAKLQTVSVCGFAPLFGATAA
jgi:hypothetical protein